MEDDPPLEPGTKVLVSRAGEPHNTFVPTEEAGTVLGGGLEYATGSGILRNDGILVKLQISNTRGIFPPAQVQRMEPRGLMSSPIPSQRRSRRVRVTPSPSILEQLAEDTPVEISSAAAARKRNLDQVDDEMGGNQTGVVKSSKYFHGAVDESSTTTSSNSEENASSGTTSTVAFRVQKAPSSSAKCVECKQSIAKNLLRLQPALHKRGGWYHVACAKESLCDQMPATTIINDMEGFSELSSAEQQLLRTQLGGGNEDSSLAAVNVMEVEESEEVEDPPLASLKKNPTKKKMTAAVAKRKTSDEPDEVEDGVLRASDTDSDDLRDMPYRVEYATTGRATCRGCDDRIAKGLLRVAEQPLFRGKPGFTVYRHLPCTVFPEEIARLQDVGGWRRLRKDDREAVIERIEKSKVLVEQENQELQPDELVQAGFEGEIRSPPKGLTAGLLPFQVEGVSWMVHQELHVPEIRGGILADEMVRQLELFSVSRCLLACTLNKALSLLLTGHGKDSPNNHHYPGQPPQVTMVRTRS